MPGHGVGGEGTGGGATGARGQKVPAHCSAGSTTTAVERAQPGLALERQGRLCGTGTARARTRKAKKALRRAAATEVASSTPHPHPPFPTPHPHHNYFSAGTTELRTSGMHGPCELPGRRYGHGQCIRAARKRRDDDGSEVTGRRTGLGVILAAARRFPDGQRTASGHCTGCMGGGRAGRRVETQTCTSHDA
jgi:hypothetical protein